MFPDHGPTFRIAPDPGFSGSRALGRIVPRAHRAKAFPTSPCTSRLNRKGFFVDKRPGLCLFELTRMEGEMTTFGRRVGEVHGSRVEASRRKSRGTIPLRFLNAPDS